MKKLSAFTLTTARALIVALPTPRRYPSRPMGKSALLLTVLAAPLAGSAQQIVEVDYSAGRTIIDDEWRSMRTAPLVVDWDRARLYVRDREEPDGIMVFSLETGEHVHTISTPRGDGPFEFSQGMHSMVLTDDGGLHVSGLLRVVTYDANYQPVRTWTPQAHPRHGVCDLGGKPAVPLRGGVLRHESETLGQDAVTGDHLGVVSSREELMAIGMQLSTARIICTEDRAFTVVTYLEGLNRETLTRPQVPDSLLVYHVNGRADRVALPAEYTEDWGCEMGGKPCPPWSARLRPSFDERHNLVLLSSDFRIAGAIINADTGCYALIRKDTEKLSDRHLLPVAVRGDSILVFEQDRSSTTTFLGGAVKASLHRVRRVSGEPCPGMLSSD